MKELSIEGKAKRYDEALDNAKAVYKTIRKDLKPVIEQIFPELKEDEDEEIRKALIEWFEEFPEKGIWRGHIKNHILAWLEKQGGK